MTAMRIVGYVVATVALAVGIYVVRDATISTHSPKDPASRLEVTVSARVNGAEDGQSLEAYAMAKVLSCRTEVVASDPTTDLRPVEGEDGTYRFVLQPSLDDTDRKQFRGCLEDWNLDHVLVDVLDMRELARG